MKPVPLPLSRCGGLRLRFGAFRVTFILILATALLSSVAGALTCLSTVSVSGEKECTKAADPCCHAQLFFTGAEKPTALGCSYFRDPCKKSVEKGYYCERNGEPKKWGKDAIDCYCPKDRCNNEKETWKDDHLYQEVTMTGPWATTTPSSKSNAAVVSGLLVVVAALSSLPHLITAIF